jgi:hypothetical protein
MQSPASNRELTEYLSQRITKVQISQSRNILREDAMPQVVKNIVLVHGAFADGSSWLKVIPLLQEMSYHVVAVQNPTTFLADEVASTERIRTVP